MRRRHGRKCFECNVGRYAYVATVCALAVVSACEGFVRNTSEQFTTTGAPMSGSPTRTEGLDVPLSAANEVVLPRPVATARRPDPPPTPTQAATTTIAPSTTTTAATATTTTTTAPPATTIAPSTTTTAATAMQRKAAPRPADEWRPLVAAYFRSEDVERVLDIIACESSGDPNALNPAPTAHGHATGLLQHLEDFWPERVIAANEAGYTNGGDIWDAEDQMAVSAYLAYRTPQRFTHWVCNP